MTTFSFAIIKRLARKVENQNLYTRAKEINGIKLFRNDFDFSFVQIMYLSWLETYHSMYFDLALNKPNISEEVIKDDLRTEAYLFWKSKNKDNEEGIKKTKDLPPEVPKMIFSKKVKR